MRIGIFTETYPPFVNGVSTSILMLQKALEKKGHTVYIVTVNKEKLKYEYEDGDKILRLPSLSLHCYDYRFTSVYPIKAIKKIKEMNLDVIHTHVELTVGMFARIVSTQLGIPLVHTYHTMWEDYTHYITHGNKYLDKPSKELVKYLSVFWGDKTTTELIVPTKKIYDLFKDKYKVTKNIHIVPTGIDVERFYKENFTKEDINKIKKEYNIGRRDFVIITVSRLAKEKSVDRLINNHKEIVKKHPNIKLLIVGDGPDTDLLKKQVSDLKLDKNVIFTGKIPLEKVQYYYQVANVFATASTTETQGLTVSEAMAASLPVLAVNDESFSNVVVNDLNGYLFNSDDEYINGVIKLYKDRRLYDRFSNESRILSESQSSSYFADRVLKVYEIAIKNYNKENRKIKNKIKRVIEKGRQKVWKK